MHTQNPIEIFSAWFAEAKQKEDVDATAAALATATNAGIPSVRIVLLKAFDERGFVFYTNLLSRKAKELLANPNAALCFYWPKIGRQIRIEGHIELVTEAEANAYFATRERGSQIGAWASQQSQLLTDKKQLQQRIKQYEEKFADANIPRPEFWSGFRLIPTSIEFWQQGKSRLHERIHYDKTKQGWEKTFLYP